MRRPDGLPATHRELWATWLGYRIPHWDAIEDDVARELSGSRAATVRVGWDGTTGAAAEWHVTLFTLTAETTERARAVAASDRHKPVGYLLHHVVSDAPHIDAVPPEDPRPEQLRRGVEGALAREARARRAERDALAPLVQRERLRASAEELKREARERVEEAVTAGLELRRGFLLVPPMVITPEMLCDAFVYEALRTLRAALAPKAGDATPWRPRGITVCRACTTVFSPRRRSISEFCDLCQKRKAKPFVVGQRPIAPGVPQTVRTPKLRGSVITGWTSTTIGLCVACGKPYTGRRDASACAECANRVRQRRHREARAAAPEQEQ